MRRRREFEIFTMSFLDAICCGFGSMILLFIVTRVGEPMRLEESKTDLHGVIAQYEQELNDILGETDKIRRNVATTASDYTTDAKSVETLRTELERIRQEVLATVQDAKVTNEVEGKLAMAKQSLTDEMKRLLVDYKPALSEYKVGGIPVDSEYIIFIIDTSSSMTTNHWDVNLAIVEEILSLYPHVAGLQVLNDQGRYLFAGTRGKWLSDTPQQREEIRNRARQWRAFSQSNPVPGMEEALRSYWSAERRISLFVLGDEFTGDSIQAALDSIGRLNKPDRNGRRPVRIHAIGFPEAPDMAPFTNIRFSALMRLVCEQNNGTFVGLKQ